MRLPTKDSSLARAVRTALFAAGGFIVGLVVVVWHVPGVPHAVITYTQQNFMQLVAYFGVPAGIGSFAWNFFARKDVENY